MEFFPFGPCDFFFIWGWLVPMAMKYVIDYQWKYLWLHQFYNPLNITYGDIILQLISRKNPHTHRIGRILNNGYFVIFLQSGRLSSSVLFVSCKVFTIDYLWEDWFQLSKLANSITLTSSQQGQKPTKTKYLPNKKGPAQNERYRSMFLRSLEKPNILLLTISEFNMWLQPSG